MGIMPIECIEDWELRLARQDAFWDGAIIDRPVVTMAIGRPNPDYPWPEAKPYATIRERWMDTDRVVSQALAGVMNTEYLGDHLPTAWPNLGPEVFSSFYGMEMEYSPDSSWGIPNLLDWAEADALRLSRDNFYWKKLEEMTDALLDAGRGKFYVGYTDMHPGGDALAAFRDPQQLATDLLLYPGDVKRLLERVNHDFFETFDYFFGKLRGAGQACTSWPGIVSTRKWHVPSNDFSCMVSKEMFDEFFLPGIAAECRHMEANIYHLDGPGALQHLDSLLAIPELNVIQWVYGAGHGRASDWLHVHKKCQAAGKGVQVGIEPNELDAIIANLRPEGLWLNVAVRNRDEADEVLRRVSRWT
ncbi:MAG: Trimethylamine corrinoid protein 2 [Candidatus Hydrogenedentes bacterium]|nr:Trimethylamine corrinoid protein 2 [Candidatus Hydrogenedentota bacterium]